MIYRDGKNIAQTSSPYFIDQSAQKGSIYTYSIIAIDGPGNQSPQSSSITVSFGVTGKNDTENSTSVKGNGNKDKKNN